MAEEDNPKKQHAIFGSAGMAASGMMPGSKKKPKPKEAPEPEQVEAEEVVEEIPEEEAAPVVEASAEPEPTAFKGLHAVVAGHSGAGDFGHGLDTLFQRLDGVRLFALSDQNEASLEETKAISGALEGYSDYATMFAAESPDLVCVAPGWTNDRFAMIKAALGAGAHVISEAPLAQTLKEADELLALGASAERQIAVMYPMRLDPHVIAFRDQLTDLIGDLKQIRAWGSCDETAGGEDLLLAGTQLFDLVRYFAGEVNYCAASISKDGMAAIAEDAHESETRKLGPLLGDVINAEFEMDSGIQVSFVSDATLGSALGPAGMEFVGTRSRMRLFAGTPVTLSLLKNPEPGLATRTDEWEQWPATDGAYHAPVEHLTGASASNRLVVKDWLSAIHDSTTPTASAMNALKALEMAHGVWQAAVTMKRAFFPLANRLHPLSEDSQ